MFLVQSYKVQAGKKISQRKTLREGLHQSTQVLLNTSAKHVAVTSHLYYVVKCEIVRHECAPVTLLHLKGLSACPVLV